MATLTITGAPSTGNPLARSANMSDSDFGTVLAAYAATIGHPEFTAEQTFERICDDFLAKLMANITSFLQQQAAAAAAASITPPTFSPA